MADKTYVYQIWETRTDQDRYRDDKIEDTERVFASKADAQAVCDEHNDPILKRAVNEALSNYERAVKARQSAVEANEILKAGGSSHRAPVPRQSVAPDASAIEKRLASSDGWLYVEEIELVPDSKVVKPTQCHYCLDTLVWDDVANAWVTMGADAAFDCCEQTDDGYHSPQSAWIPDA